jgi:hypothetical protein
MTKESWSVCGDDTSYTLHHGTRKNRPGKMMLLSRLVASIGDKGITARDSKKPVNAGILWWILEQPKGKFRSCYGMQALEDLATSTLVGNTSR